MVFSSFEFLLFFLPVTLLLHGLAIKWSSNVRTGNFILLLASLTFYALGETWFVCLLMGSTAVDYFCALLIARRPKTALAPPHRLRLRSPVNGGPSRRSNSNASPTCRI